MQTLFLKDVLGSRIAPRKLDTLKAVNADHVDDRYKKVKPANARWALVASLYQYDGESGLEEESWHVLCWFEDMAKAEDARETLMDRMTLNLDFLVSPTWGGVA